MMTMESAPSRAMMPGLSNNHVNQPEQTADFAGYDQPLTAADADVQDVQVYEYDQPSTYIYTNSIGSDNSNADVVRSEMMFYNTPLTEKYAQAAYGAVQNIQDQCAVDFQSLCARSAPYMNLNDMMAQLMMPAEATYVYRGRKLTEVKPFSELQTGAEYVDYLRSFYRPHHFGSHPFSNVMYRDSASGKFVSPEHKHAEGSEVREGHEGKNLRLAKPGWTMPALPTTTGATVAEHIRGKLSSKPRSYASHTHVNKDETHRRLRLAAPGWKMPTSPTNAEPTTLISGAPEPMALVEETAQELKDYDLTDSSASDAAPAPRKPCSHKMGTTAGTATASSNSAGPQEAVFDMRSFISDFFSGKDVNFALMPMFQSQLGNGAGNQGTTVQFVRLADDDAGGQDDDDFYADDLDDLDDGADDGSAYYYGADDAAADDDDQLLPADDEAQGALSVKGGFAAQVKRGVMNMLAASRPLPRLGDRGTRSALPQMLGQVRPMGGRPPQNRRRDGPGSASSEEGSRRGHEGEHDRDHDHRHGGPDGSSEEEEDGKSRESGEGSSEEHGHDRHHDRQDKHSSSSSSEEHSGGRFGPPPPVSEDHSFSGSLGFGADGDMCMYQGMAQGMVSQPCMGAVSGLYQLRAQYWEESQMPPPPPHCHLGLILIAAALLGCCVRRFYAARYEKKVRSLLTALHTHPHLKASVEAETGIQVPMPKPACCLSNAAQGPQGSRKSWLARTCKALVLFVALLFVSFVVSFTSLEITMNIVGNLDSSAQPDPNTGETPQLSPFAALTILFLVCTAELTLLALVVRGLRACCTGRRCCEESNGKIIVLIFTGHLQG